MFGVLFATNGDDDKIEDVVELEELEGGSDSMCLELSIIGSIVV